MLTRPVHGQIKQIAFARAVGDTVVGKTRARGRRQHLLRTLIMLVASSGKGSGTLSQVTWVALRTNAGARVDVDWLAMSSRSGLSADGRRVEAPADKVRPSANWIHTTCKSVAKPSQNAESILVDAP